MQPFRIVVQQPFLVRITLFLVDGRKPWCICYSSFVQTNDDFPIFWTDETFIGLSYADIFDKLHITCSTCAKNSSYSYEIDCENDGTITQLICTFINKDNGKNSFSLLFSIAEDRVFEIAFDFLQG